MVEGHEIAYESRPLVVVDLDGTLVRGNTFRIFIKCGILCLASSHKYLRLFITLTLLALKKLRLISHRQLKFKVIPELATVPGIRDRFTACVRELFDKDVEAQLDAYMKDGCKILLATAAADTYIPWIYNGEYQATDMANEKMIENRGEEKLKNVLDFARKHNLELQTVITDHSDDMPLLKYGAYTILVHPSDKTLDILHRESIRIDKIIR